MTAQDVIAESTAKLVRATKDPAMWSTMDDDERGHYLGEAQAVLDALAAAGYAVVELPKPVHCCDRDAAWITPDGEFYQVDFDRRNGIWASDRTTTTGQTFGPVMPKRAREVAVALLAAAAHAEAGEGRG